MRGRLWLLGAIGIGAIAACTTGKIGSSDGTSGGEGPGPSVEAPEGLTGVGKSGIRRLTRYEYDATIADLLGDPTRIAKALPEDYADPFDNDFTTQATSQALIEALETLAEQASAKLMTNPALRDRVVGCKPSGPADAACMKTFVTTFGRRAFRRPLADDDVERYVAMQSFAVESNDFYEGVDVVLRAMLQDPRFVYRVEMGTPVSGRPGTFKLDGYEVASRLSYFMWGTTPDDALLDAASSGKLNDAAGIRAEAKRLFDSPRAKARIERFHALWMGYEQLPHAADLNIAMRKETDALIDRVVFEKKGSWLDILQSDETFANDLLAKHYGLPGTGSTEHQWIKYPESSKRKGILSHGSFLSVAGKFGDTSPTQRGILIRTRLMCQDIPPPPPTVNADEPPKSASKCKIDRYAEHRAGGCAGCHKLTDGVGFGLENFDQAGRYRTTDKDAPECVIAGEGEISGVGTFNGPAQLGALLTKTGDIDRCLVTQLYRFAMGHKEATEDQPYVEAMRTKFTGSGYKLDELMLEVVSAPAFGYRMEE